jgi:hypothetical protein
MAQLGLSIVDELIVIRALSQVRLQRCKSKYPVPAAGQETVEASDVFKVCCLREILVCRSSLFGSVADLISLSCRSSED